MKPRILSTARLSFPLATAIAALLAATSAHAANIWDGGGADTNWGTVANWDNNLLPTYGTLTFSGSVRPTNVNNLFTNAGVVTVGAGTLNMSQLNFNSATAFTISGNAISLFDNGGVQSKIENNGAGLATINLNTTFAATAGAAWGEINAINGNLTFGTGTLTVNGSQVAGIRMFGGGRTTTFNGTVSASGKYFATTAANTTVAIGGAFTSGDFYLMNNGTLRINTGGTLTTSGGGSPALRLGGDFTTTGTQNLTQGATFQLAPLTGGLTVNALINTVGSNTSNALLIDSLNTSGTNTLAGDFYLDSNLRVNQASGGTITISDATTDIKGQTLTLTGTGGLVNLTGVVGNSVGSGQVVVGVDGTVGGPTVTMSQANTYGGQTFVRAGTLAFTSTGSAANSVIRLGSTSGASVTAGVNLTTLTGATTISSTINAVTTSGSGTLSINSNNTSGTNTLSGQIALDRSLTITQAAGGTLNITQVKGVDNTTGNDIKSFTETFTPAALGTINVSGTIYNSTGSGSVLMNGAGTLTLTGANTYTGGTNINAGTLSFASGALGTTGNITVNGGTLLWGTGNTSDISSRLTLVTAGTASLNTNNQTVAFASGTNNVTSTLTKTGTGTLTMNGNNLHDGLTTVAGGGILTLAGDNTGMTGGVTLDGTTASTRLNINSDTALGTGTFTISGAGNGSIANSSGATRTLSTNNAQTWGQSFAVVATNSLDMGTGTVNLGSATRVVSLSGGGIFTVGGVISGTGGITLGGGGTMALTNTASTYTGLTIIGNNSSTTILRVTKLANLSQASSLGAPTTATNGVIQIGQTSISGTLELVGTVGTDPSSTNRQVRIGSNGNGAGNATIVNNNTDAANSLIFTNPAFNLSNATTGSSRSLTLGGLNAGANEIQGAIINNANNVGVSVNGSGAWRLSGNNTYSNATTVSGTATLTLSGNNSGAAGGVTLSTATTVNSPRLNLNSATALGTGTLNFGGGLATDTVRLDNTSAGLVNVSTNNVFTLSRDFTFIGTQSLNLGNMTTTLGGLTTGTSRNITVTANTLTFGGTIGQAAANLGVNKLGAGTLALNNANTFSGNVSVNGGTLLIGNASALGFGARQTTATGTTTVSNGFTLDLNGAATVNEPLILSGTGIGGNGALVNTNTGATAIIGNGIAGIQQSAATNGSGYSSAPTITISGTGSGATATALLGVTALSFTGFAGGDKVYTVAPTVTISGGGGGAGATATAVLSGGATGTLTGFTITNAGSGFTTIPTITFGAGTFSSGTINGSATGNDTEFTVSGLSMTAAGSGYTGTPTYTIDSGNATPGSVSLSSVILAADSSIGGAGNTTINSVVSESGGARGLTKVGVGTVTLSGVNTYSGTTTISNGTLALSGGNNVLADTNAVNIDNALGIFDISAITTSETIGSLTGVASSSVVLGSKNLTVGDATNTAYAGVISGASGSLTKVGGGILTLSGINTYTGTTTVSNGTLALSGGSNVLADTNAVNIDNAAGIFDISAITTSETIGSLAGVASSSVVLGSKNLTVGDATNTAYAGVISGTSGSLTKVGGGILTLSGANTYTGDTTITTGTLQLGSGSTTGSLSASSAIVNNANLTINRSNAVAQGTDFSGADITGTGSFTQAGAGTTSLNVLNSYSGGTTVSAGTLALSHNNAAGTAGIAVSGASAATLQIDAGITLAGNNITFSNTNAASSVKHDVAIAGTYTTGTSGNLTTSFVGGQADTTAQILDGTSSVATTLEMLFAGTSAATNDAIRRSDVFTTAGTSTDTYVIQLSTGALAADSVLAWLNGSNEWVHAGTTFFNETYSFAARSVGDYGYDSGNVWAVVNHGGSFTAVPEPTSALVGLLIGAGLLRRRRTGLGRVCPR